LRSGDCRVCENCVTARRSAESFHASQRTLLQQPRIGILPDRAPSLAEQCLYRRAVLEFTGSLETRQCCSVSSKRLIVVTAAKLDQANHPFGLSCHREIPRLVQ